MGEQARTWAAARALAGAAVLPLWTHFIATGVGRHAALDDMTIAKIRRSLINATNKRGKHAGPNRQT